MFSIQIPVDGIEGSISDISLGFMRELAPTYALQMDNIYLWKPQSTSEGPKEPVAGTGTWTPPSFTYKYISGLAYIDPAAPNNQIAFDTECTDLADGSLKNNYIKFSNKGLEVNQISNITINAADKCSELDISYTFTFPRAKFQYGNLSFNLEMPKTDGAWKTENYTHGTRYCIYGANDTVSNDLIEDFITEDKRLQSDFTTQWVSDARISGDDAVVQNSRLYHKNYIKSPGTGQSSYVPGESISGYSSTYGENATTGPCSYYRIFKDTSFEIGAGETTFYITVNENATDTRNLINSNDIQLIVQRYDSAAGKWEVDEQGTPIKYIANKEKKPGNDGLADFALVNGKMKCVLDYSTMVAEGIRMEIRLNHGKSLDKIEVSFKQ